MEKYVIVGNYGDPSMIESDRRPVVYGGVCVDKDDLGYGELLAYAEKLELMPDNITRSMD